MKIWYPTLVMAIIIFILSSFPAPESDKQSGLIVNAVQTLFPDMKNAKFLVTAIRKTAHFLEYATLGFLTARSFKLSKLSPWLAIPVCALYAGSDEFHQTFIHGRSGELKDVALDTLGSTFGIFIYWLFHRKKA